MEKLIAIGIVVFIAFVVLGVFALCKASGEADRHSERMMNDKEDKEQR